MSYIDATLCCQPVIAPTAQLIADNLPGHVGMFRSFTKAGGGMGDPEAGDTPIMYCSSGAMNPNSPMFMGRDALIEALAETSVTEADIDLFLDNVDIQLPGTGARRLAELEALRVEAEAAGLPWWRKFTAEFSEEFA